MQEKDKGLTCQICDRSGHIALDCYQRLTQTYQHDMSEATAALFISGAPKDTLFLDKGASKHMSPDDEFSVVLLMFICKFIWLGYKAGVKGYRLWDPDAKKRIVSYDVVFDESSMMIKQNADKFEVVQNCGKTMEVEIHDHESQEVDQQSMEDLVQHQDEQQSIAEGTGKLAKKAPNRRAYSFPGHILGPPPKGTNVYGAGPLPSNLDGSNFKGSGKNSSFLCVEFALQYICENVQENSE
ncbi:hypothetical protein RJ640_025524 [Escallonia rubra]|uniref:Retroviral polymerase SH3-like domain-containing protein n=1 Tax=Escallonia rubra TaxID=112253 RepID=A0AA88RP52_9ASTE|nr:hypothetical protein RJ640_025524 [Escallonia rubra]